MEEKIGLWFDREGDLLELTIGRPRKGFFVELENDIWKRVDVKTGKTIGLMVLNFTKRFKKEELKIPFMSRK